jgi:hypothetical protein
MWDKLLELVCSINKIIGLKMLRCPINAEKILNDKWTLQSDDKDMM